MQSTEYKPWAKLLTCLAQYRTRAQTTHHCALELPHDEHRCPCGIAWRANSPDKSQPEPAGKG